MSSPWRSTVASDGRTFAEVRRTLTPQWGRVWLQLGLGFALLFGGVSLSAALAGRSFLGDIALVGLTAAWVGVWMHYVQLFFHEASHYNLAPGRPRNDFLANLVIGSWVGQDIAPYRVVHFEHHRHLGTPKDLEHSYFEALTPRFLLESITGIRVLRVLGGRRKALEAKTGTKTPPAPRRWPLAFGLALHGSIVGALLLSGAVSTAVGWVVGIGSVLPAVLSVRQILEHRALDADPRTDYARVDHGEVNRMFGDGPVAWTLGAAGFNRHLLHHLEPQVPCTRLAELQSFLEDTSYAPEIARASTSYLATFVALIGPPRNSP